MAIDLCSENSGMSPRISFSHDLSHADVVPVEHLLRSNSSSSSADFDFFVFRDIFDHESSSADELFSEGKILPIPIKKRMTPPPPTAPPSPPPTRQASKSTTNETKMVGSESDDKQKSKSFWGFNRSSSLNCGSGYARSLCPLPLLSRSNSTGSAASSVKKSSLPKTPSLASTSSTTYQKPPLKKNYVSHGNGVRINPVLNVSTANLFGLGSIFSNVKDRSKKR